MKFEEVLPALREGKKIKRKRWDVEFIQFQLFDSIEGTPTKGLVCRTYPDVAHFISEISLWDDWEIVEESKQKVKCYPALFKWDSLWYKITDHKFKNNAEATHYLNSQSTYQNVTFIRLITEIPELIEEIR